MRSPLWSALILVVLSLHWLPYLAVLVLSGRQPSPFTLAAWSLLCALGAFLAETGPARRRRR